MAAVKQTEKIGKGKPGPGRPIGTPNKATADVRAAIATFASANVESMGEWLNSIDDPAKKLDLYLRAIEYHIPKLARTEIDADVRATGLPTTINVCVPKP